MGLDGVEILMGVEESFGIAISDPEAEKICTVRDMIDFVALKVPTIKNSECLTNKIFFKLRRGFRTQILALVPDFRLQTKIKDILTKEQWPKVWASIRQQVGEDNWPTEIPWSSFFKNGPVTIRDLVYHIAFQLPKPDISNKEPWTRQQISLEVRRVIYETMRVVDYKEDSEFVKDLGVN